MEPEKDLPADNSDFQKGPPLGVVSENSNGFGPFQIGSQFTLSASSSVQTYSSSPLPSPELLQGYRDKGFTDIPETIIAMVRDEQKHRFRMDEADSARKDYVIKRYYKTQIASVHGTFFCVIVGILAASACAAGGVPTASVTAIVACVTGLPCAAFGLNKWLSRKEEQSTP